MGNRKRPQGVEGRNRRLLAALGIASVGIALTAVPGRAGTPSTVDVGLAGSGFPLSMNWAGPAMSGNPDPTGPPTQPVCSNAIGCDRETVNVHVGPGFNATTTIIDLTAAASWNDPTGNSNFDISIYDINGTKLASSVANTPTPGTSTQTIAKDVAPGTYTVELDGDIAFNVAYSGTASLATRPRPAPVTSTPGPMGFTHEVTVDPQRLAGEPAVAIAGDGREMYADAPWGFSTTTSFVWKTEDGGAQWDALHGGCPAQPLRADCSRGGGDEEIQLGTPQGATLEQAAFWTDLNGLDTISCAYSTDGGNTFTVSGNNMGQACNVASQNPSGSDRPWTAVWPKTLSGKTADHVYTIYDTGETPPGSDAAIKSLDGGHNWVSACNLCIGGANAVGVHPGNLVINQNTGTLYQFMPTSSSGNAGVEVNISCDEGTTWNHVEIVPVSSTVQTGGNDHDFVVGAIDTQGNLYVVWSNNGGAAGRWQVWYAHSTDAGTTLPAGSMCSNPVKGGAWSSPISLNGTAATGQTTVAAPGVNYAVFPWITAGDPGRVDVAYYGTDHSTPYDPSTQTATWNVHVSQSLNGLTTAAGGATFTDNVASETPNHIQQICFNGIGCTGPPGVGGDRNLSDFFEVQHDDQGRAVVVYTDDNNSAAAGASGWPGGPIVSSVQQTSGPSLFLTHDPITAPVASLTQSVGISNEVIDRSGDAHLPAHGATPGANVDAADITDVKVLPRDASSFEILMTVKNFHGNPMNAIAGTHTGATWMATWHRNNDLWFASASIDAAGSKTFLAGKPVSEALTGGNPKAYAYIKDPNTAPVNSTIPPGVFDTTNNTVEIDVPFSAVGNVQNGSELFGFTGFTLDVVGGTPQDSNLSVPIADQVDATAPIDAIVNLPGVVTPETRWIPLFVGLGGLVVAAIYVRRRRPWMSRSA